MRESRSIVCGDTVIVHMHDAYERKHLTSPVVSSTHNRKSKEKFRGNAYLGVFRQSTHFRKTLVPLLGAYAVDAN